CGPLQTLRGREPRRLGRSTQEPGRGGRGGARAIPVRDQGADRQAVRCRLQADVRPRRHAPRRGAGKELGHDLRIADDLSRPAQGQADHRLPHHGPPAGRRPGLRVTVPDPRQVKTMNAPMADRTKASDTASVEGKNVVKTFGGFTAVDDVSCTYGKGEFVSLIGPSGCGKSTLMLIAAGLQPLSTGAIVVNGAPLDRPLT